MYHSSKSSTDETSIIATGRHMALKTRKQSQKETSQTLPSKAEFQAISLFSVDQIREKESPWKALPETALNTLGQQTSKRSVKRPSPFKQRLQERKKVCMLYGGLSKRSLDRYLKEISRPEDIILLLESRLDIVLKRSLLFPCIQSARKSILQGGISVNHEVVCSPRYHCTSGDLIKVVERRKGAQRPILGKSLKQQARLVMHTPPRDQHAHLLKSRASKTLRLDEWDNVFAFSERLRVWDRRVGRLYTSVLEERKEWDSLVDLEASRVNHVSLMPLHKPMRNIEREFKANTTDHTDSLNPVVACVLQAHALPENNPQQERENASLIKTRLSNTNQLLVGERAEWQTTSSSQIGSRALHLEVSYRNLSVIFLYTPQRLCLDVLIDLSKLC